MEWRRRAPVRSSPDFLGNDTCHDTFTRKSIRLAKLLVMMVLHTFLGDANSILCIFYSLKTSHMQSSAQKNFYGKDMRIIATLFNVRQSSAIEEDNQANFKRRANHSLALAAMVAC